MKCAKLVSPAAKGQIARYDYKSERMRENEWQAPEESHGQRPEVNE